MSDKRNARYCRVVVSSGADDNHPDLVDRFGVTSATRAAEGQTTLTQTARQYPGEHRCHRLWHNLPPATPAASTRQPPWASSPASLAPPSVDVPSFAHMSSADPPSSQGQWSSLSTSTQLLGSQPDCRIPPSLWATLPASLQPTTDPSAVCCSLAPPSIATTQYPDSDSGPHSILVINKNVRRSHHTRSGMCHENLTQISLQNFEKSDKLLSSLQDQNTAGCRRTVFSAAYRTKYCGMLMFTTQCYQDRRGSGDGD
ncbi:hypothetical protein ACOMHN_008980 [Nucella lapillus]